MGSTGSGRFSDYPRDPAPADKCEKAFAVNLEDIEHCDYFTTHKTVPKVGTVLKIARKKRVVAQTEDNETVGNLPTSFNYLAACLEAGFEYVGHVTDSNDGPVAVISADFAVRSE